VTRTYNAPEQVIEPGRQYRATVATSHGTFAIDLNGGAAPLTVNSFAFLAGEGFYDGTPVHRVVPGFVVQMGDPTGTGTGGPGYQFADELDAAREKGYPRGTVAMANAGPNTNGSQFFVVLEDAPLPPDYTVFGEVVDGLEAVDAIAGVPLDGERPAEPVTVESVRVEAV
jgi:cyclophilin family peptidyl-prolyl cis-trans isomerase